MKKNFMKFWLVALPLLSVLFAGCKSTDEPDPEVVKIPEITALSEGAITLDEATIKVEFKDADIIYYTLEADDSDWKVKAVSEDETSVNVTFEGLESNTEYTARVYAAYESKESEVAEITFTTPLDDSPTLKLENVEIASSTAGQVVATVTYSSKIIFCYYITDASAGDEPQYGEVECVDGQSEYVIDIENLPESTEADVVYTVEAYSVGIDGSTETEVQTVEFTLVKAVLPTASLSVVSVDESTATIEITLADGAIEYDYTVYKASEVPAEGDKVWVKNSLDAVANEAIVKTISLTELEGPVEYVIEAYAINEGEVHGDVASASFTTLDPNAPYKVTDITVKSTELTVTVELDLEQCDGVAVYNTASAWYSEADFTSMLTNGWLGSDNLLSESGSLTFLYLTQNTNYTIATAAYRTVDTGEGYNTYEIIGSVQTTTCTTLPITPGTGNEISISILPVDITLNSATASLTRASSETVSYYAGAAPVADVNNGDVAAWLVSTDWFSTASASNFSQYDYATGELKDVEIVSAGVYGLNSGVDYLFFAIPVLSDGSLGGISTAEFTTNSLTVNPELTYTVDVVAAQTSADITVNFGSADVVGVAYYNQAVGGYMTDEQIESNLVSTISDYYTYYMILNNAGTNVGTYSQTYLSMGTTYKFYTMGFDASGCVTEMQVNEYTTTKPDYSSSASVSLTLTSDVLDDWGGVDLGFDVAMENGAVEYYYGVADKDYVPNPVAAAYADWLLNSGSAVKTSATSMTMTLYNSSYIGIFIPIDANGDMGTAVIYEYTGWDSAE